MFIRGNRLRVGLVGVAALAALVGIAPAAAAAPAESGSLNGDGAPDLLIGEPDGGLMVHVSDPEQANTEGGPLLEQQLIGEVAEDARWYGHGDVDGDGAADVALVTEGGELRIAKVSVSEDGQISLGEFVTAGYGFGHRDLVFIGDLNGDDRADLLARKAGSNTTDGYLNNGADIGVGMFDAGEPVLTTASGVVTQRMADVTGDGQADVLSIRDNGELHLRDLSTDSSFLIGDGWNRYDDMTVSDYQNDGLPDLFAVHADGGAQFHLMEKPFDPDNPRGVFSGLGYAGDPYNAPYWTERQVFG